MKHFFILILAFYGLLIAPRSLHGAYNAFTEKWLTHALSHHPQIVAQRHLVASYKHHRYSGNEIFPATPFSLSWQNNTSVWSVSQGFPFALKSIKTFSLRDQQYQAHLQGLRQQKAMLKMVLKSTYLNLYLKQQSIEILDRHLTLLKKLEDDLITAVSAGKPFTIKLLSIQAELLIITDQKQQLIHSQEEDIHQFHYLTSPHQMPKQVILGSLASVHLPSRPQEIPSVFSADTKQILRSPEVRGSHHNVKAAQDEERLQWLSFFPDLMLHSEMNTFTSSARPVSPERLRGAIHLSLPLTVFTQVGQLKRSKYKRLHAQASYTNVLHKAKADLLKAITLYNMKSQSHLRYQQQIKPIHQKKVAELMRSYTSFNTSSAQLIEGFRSLLDADLQILRLRIQMEHQINQLERITGEAFAMPPDEKES